MTQQTGKNPQTNKPGEHLLAELKMIHTHLRQDLATCRVLADQVRTGATPAYIREQVKSLQTSSSLWKIRVNCLYYCRVVHTHHGLEDVTLFPALREANPALGPIVDKLQADHRQVSTLLDQVEAAANALVTQEAVSTREQLVHTFNNLATDLLAHLAFEEEAIGPTLLGWDQWPTWT
jgi:iron-sulfur cluster repair protein YtfE (RIC family)